MAHHRSGDQTAQGVSNSTGPEVVVFNETQQQPHITEKAAEGSQPISEWFGATKVWKKKQYLDKSEFKGGQAPSLLKSGLLESKMRQKSKEILHFCLAFYEQWEE